MKLRPLASALGICAAIGSASCQRAEVVDSFPKDFVGVGMELNMVDGSAMVVRPLAGGSAAEAGIQSGDRIDMVDGKPITGQSLGDVVMRVRGKPDTQVTLTVDRNGQRFIMVVKRRKMAKTTDGYSTKP